MCRSLTVTCLRRIAGIELCDHFLTFSDLKIPCKDPDSAEYRDGTAELIDFQNPATTCADRANWIYLDSDERAKLCMEALEKYGRSLHRVNLEGTKKVPWWKKRGEKKSEKQKTGVTKPQDMDGDL